MKFLVIIPNGTFGSIDGHPGGQLRTKSVPVEADKYLVEASGALHLFSDLPYPRTGVKTFAPGQWLSVEKA